MAFVKRFLAFWYDFVVGDDWSIAVGSVIVLAVAGALARTGLHAAAWVLVPVGVAAVLAVSLRRAPRRSVPPRLHPVEPATRGQIEAFYRESDWPADGPREPPSY